jgi:cell division protein ZipA
MDKDLIRIIIFGIGLLVILSMVAWSYLQNEKLKRDYEGYNDDSDFNNRDHSELGYNESDYENGLDENDDYDEYADEFNENTGSPLDTNQNSRLDDSDVTPSLKKPAIIQFSIVAVTEEGFNGTDIFNVLDDIGLEYGNLQIFERLDARRLVDYGVASMVKPGIFPSTNLAAFHSPGLVFFMQPAKLDNPLAVFDDFVRTFQFVATQLDGEMWDHHREPLTEETIALIRHSLSTS